MGDRDLVGTFTRAIQAFNAGDLKTVAEVVSPDVVYTVHGQNLLAGEYRGIDGFREVLDRVKALTGGTASLEPIAVLSDQTVLMVWGRFRGTRNGRVFETLHAYYYRFDDAGRIAEGHTVPVDQHVANQFWS